MPGQGGVQATEATAAHASKIGSDHGQSQLRRTQLTDSMSHVVTTRRVSGITTAYLPSMHGKAVTAKDTVVDPEETANAFTVLLEENLPADIAPKAEDTAVAGENRSINNLICGNCRQRCAEHPCTTARLSSFQHAQASESLA